MLESMGANSFLILSVLVFVAVVLLLESLYLMWRTYKGPKARQMEKRLHLLSTSHNTPEGAQLLKQQMLSNIPALERLLQELPRAQGLQGFIAQAGMNWSVSIVLLSSIALGVGAYVLLVLLAHQPLLFAALVGTAFATMPLLYVGRQRHLRLTKLERQLPDAIDLMIRALRSGHAFSSSLQMVGEEMQEPIASEFRIVHDEVNFGVSLQQALMNLGDRIPSTDLRYFIVAVLIQRESGGNLTEILGNLSRLIRERLKLLAKVRVLSSEGRLSAWILVLMPFALAAIMNLVNPKFMSMLWTDPIGLSIIQYMLTLMAIGVLIIRKIIRIRV